MSECWDIPVISAAEGASPDWIFSLLGRATPTQRTLLLLLLWPVWYVHNEFTHGKMPPAVLASQRYLQSYAESLIGLKLFPDADIRKGKQSIGIFTISPSKPASRPDEMIAWQPRGAAGWTKLNVDGSFVSETGDTGPGMILHDHQGQVLFSAVRHLPACNDALESELAACMEGLAIALQRTTLPIQIETDSAQLITLVQQRGFDRSRYSSLVTEIKGLLASQREIKLIKIHRSQNGVSHDLAGFARVNRRTACWLLSNPLVDAQDVTLL